MSRERITATGDDAEQFSQIRERMSEGLNGELTNAEVLRQLMREWERDNSRGLR